MSHRILPGDSSLCSNATYARDTGIVEMPHEFEEFAMFTLFVGDDKPLWEVVPKRVEKTLREKRLQTAKEHERKRAESLAAYIERGYAFERE